MKLLTATILILLFLAYPALGVSTFSITLVGGSSQCLTHTDNASLSVTGDMTIEMWVKMTANPGEAFDVLMDKTGGGGQRGYEVRYYQPSSVDTVFIRMSQDGTNRFTITWAETLPQDTWIHVAMVFDASAHDVTLYLDSSFVSTQDITITGIFDSNGVFAIGCNSFIDDNFINAKFDDVRLWASERTSTEIADNYQRELTGSESGLVGYWKMEQNANDSQTSGNNDLTEQNSPTYTTDIPVFLVGRRRIQLMIQ